jgi:hypothetical protein
MKPQECRLLYCLVVENSGYVLQVDLLLVNFLHFLQILEIKCFLQESQATTAAQPVGFTAGLKGAEERIQNFRQQGNIADDIPVVSYLSQQY